ncbi:MAG TPA: UDP-N-acetylmuramoyl-L-alanine--D-glutamate ligase [Bdellovibrionota bacterium]|nr:UDP-N-acetylmuramoyl-L-alanine--D-glutamate ligase [Bdellovibrionota bacterium]
METLQGKRIAVIGLGPRTGVSLVRYLCTSGANVIAYDRRSESDLGESLRPLSGLRFDREFGTEDPRRIDGADLVLVSPGVPSDTKFLSRLRSRGKSIWSEIEFASRRLRIPVIAVTGSNGKSTTTALIAHILSHSGKRVFCGGNLGTPLIEAVDKPYDVAVAEISSFQLEAVETFHPRVGVLLNISPNHLDRHKDLRTYAGLKERLFDHMTSGNRAILNQDDATCLEIARRIHANVWFFSLRKNSDAQIRLQDGFISLPNGEKVSMRSYRLPGSHNLENALAAAGAAASMDCPSSLIEKAISTFEALPHRLQPVATIDQVRFINDSKSTTPDSAVRALESFPNPIVLLAGGRPKGASYAKLARAAQGKVRSAFFYGEAAEEMARAFSSVPHRVVKTLSEALSAALSVAQSGDVVLLSPANASFDQFKDFEDRGRTFAALVKRSESTRKGVEADR